MSEQYFEQLSSAYMAHFCRRLSDLVIEQSSQIVAEMNIKTPTTAISAMFFLDQKESSGEEVTVARLAEALGVSHQMATQRTNHLQQLSLVKRSASEHDKRAKVVLLTASGRKEVAQLKPFVEESKKVFENLERELDAPLTQLIRQAELSLLAMPLKQRIKR
jgi:DNA-binding MarR family transcriptional regulator